MTKQEAAGHLERFNRSAMAKNKDRRWIGKMLQRIAAGELPAPATVSMLCRALEIKQ